MEKRMTRKSLLAAIGVFIILLSSLALPSRALADSGPTYSVKVDKGYLALRTAPSYDDQNEIGELYTGDVVVYLSRRNKTYWWVYSPKYDREGYVNKNYLVYRGDGKGSSSYSNSTYRVTVKKGYLALRTAPAYDERNEVGELYTGDVVTFISRHNGKYWWVYSPKYDREGYVNCNYLSAAFSSDYDSRQGSYTVSVAKGYLALRTAPAYDERNEIGELYTGDTVVFISSYNNKYWWVYSPKYDREGYVNRKYLNASESKGYRNSYGNYTVSVAKGYLALRTAPAYDERNEIGELYSGDTVTVLSKPAGDYWWVYSSKYDREGYVNCHYLY